MKDESFRIGEQALLLPPSREAISQLSPRYTGTVITVVSGLISVRELTTLPVPDLLGYIIELNDGHLAWVVPRILQKLPPKKKPPAWDSDETPNAPAQFDPRIWAPSGEIVL